MKGSVITDITLATSRPVYQFNFTEAQRVCELLGGALATQQQMQAAWNQGFQMCQ